MKNKLALLSILVVAFVIFVVIRFFLFDKQNEYGKLKVISSPTASVFINNSIVGKTPFEDKYKTGEYLIKLIPETTSTDTASWNGKINVYKNSLTYVNRELGSSDISSAGEIFTTRKMDKRPKKPDYGEIYVETEPQGAIITLDNTERGVAPIVVEDISSGEHELSIFMPSFFRRTQKVNVDPGFRVNASFKLAIDQSQKMVSEEEEKKEATGSAAAKKASVKIKNNEQGWLRVREDASINASEAAKVKVGESYEFLEEKNGWYKIKYNGNKDGLVEGTFEEGWVSGEYSTKE